MSQKLTLDLTCGDKDYRTLQRQAALHGIESVAEWLRIVVLRELAELEESKLATLSGEEWDQYLAKRRTAVITDVDGDIPF